MFLHSESFQHGHNIPARYAFGKLGTDGPFALGDNVSPSLAWGEEPVGSKSFAVVCIDNDVPSRGDDVNQSGRVVPADLPRVAFTHWLLVDLPANLHELAEGACGQGVVARGKQHPPGPDGSRQGLNDFTAWFQGDAEMGGDYFGYDGPCPPWNDSIVHHYTFNLYALSEVRLDLPERFGLAEFRRACVGQVLAEAMLTGTYSINPAVPT